MKDRFSGMKRLKGQGHGVLTRLLTVYTMLSPEEAAAFLTSLEDVLKEVMRQVILDATVGDPAKISSTETSEHAITRTILAKWSSVVITNRVPVLAKTKAPIRMTFPSDFSKSVFGAENPEVDIHLQAHSGAPSVGDMIVRSPLVGMTVSRAKAATETPVKNLKQNFLLEIPIATSVRSFDKHIVFDKHVLSSSSLLSVAEILCVHIYF